MSKELREEFTAVRNEALRVRAEASKANRPLTADEKAEENKRFARCTEIQEQLEAEKKFAGLKLNDFVSEQRHEAGKVSKDSHKAAVAEYLRTGVIPHQLATMIGGTVPGGSPAGTVGVALPAAEPIFIKRMLNPFRAALSYYGLEPIRTDGVTNIPVIDLTSSTVDSIGQAYVGDNAKNDAVTSMLPPTTVYDSGTRWLSDLLVQGVPNLVEAYVKPLQDKVDLQSALAFVTSILATGTVGVTTASTTAFTPQELINWRYSLPAEYQSDAVIVASTGFMQTVVGLPDTTGRSMFVESLSDAAPNTFLGAPIFLSSALSAPGAGNVPAILASASSLIVTQNGPQQVLRYSGESAHPMQTGIRVCQVGGAGFIPNGVRLLKNHV